MKTVLTFGDRPSPTMATVAMRKSAEFKEESKPEAAEAIKKNTYMDDMCDSQASKGKARTLTSDIDEVLDAGGFRVKEWISNIPLKVKESPGEVVLGEDQDNNMQKVLGTVWHPKEDQFSFKVKVDFANTAPNNDKPIPATPTKLKKRLILSKLSGIFDPIGAGAVVLIKAKIAMQELWQHGLSWDEEVPPEVKKKWMTLFNEMNALNIVRFKRCLTPPGAICDPYLVIFCDASRLAFGACAYTRWKLADGTFAVEFIAANSRVAPLRELTIPRLELQAAVLASRLAKTILKETSLTIL